MWHLWGTALMGGVVVTISSGCCRANIAGAWLFTALSLGLLAYEYRRFIKLRFVWLTLPRTHNYSIMVSTPLVWKGDCGRGPSCVGGCGCGVGVCVV
jgi:hypothetical protein